MSLSRWLLLVALLALAVRGWSEWRETKAMQAVMSPNGFLPIPMPPEAEPDTVLIFAPLNCPHEEAQRADALASELTRLGIANVRTSHYGSVSFEPSEEQEAAFKRLNVVMTGQIPIALINGMGKANPSLDELVAEYKRTR